MGYSASDTAEKHARILNEASRLFRERGFSGVSVSEIMKAAGLTHGPFYNHFPSKEALMAESLACALQSSLDKLEGLGGTKEGRAKYIENYLTTSHRDAPGTGCFVATLSPEVRHESHVRGPFTAQLKALLEKLTTYFPWQSKRSARGDAIRTLSALVGALILARAVDDEALSEEILEEVKKSLI